MGHPDPDTKKAISLIFGDGFLTLSYFCCQIALIIAFSVAEGRIASDVVFASGQ